MWALPSNFQRKSHGTPSQQAELPRSARGDSVGAVAAGPRKLLSYASPRSGVLQPQSPTANGTGVALWRGRPTDLRASSSPSMSEIAFRHRTRSRHRSRNRDFRWRGRLRERWRLARAGPQNSIRSNALPPIANGTTVANPATTTAAAPAATIHVLKTSIPISLRAK